MSDNNWFPCLVDEQKEFFTEVPGSGSSKFLVFFIIFDEIILLLILVYLLLLFLDIL